MVCGQESLTAIIEVLVNVFVVANISTIGKTQEVRVL